MRTCPYTPHSHSHHPNTHHHYSHYTSPDPCFSAPSLIFHWRPPEHHPVLGCHQLDATTQSANPYPHHCISVLSPAHLFNITYCHHTTSPNHTTPAPYPCLIPQVVTGAPLNTTQYWDVINLTPDAVPVHLHNTEFRVRGRIGRNRTRNLNLTERNLVSDAVLGCDTLAVQFLSAWQSALKFKRVLAARREHAGSTTLLCTVDINQADTFSGSCLAVRRSLEDRGRSGTAPRLRRHRRARHQPRSRPPAAGTYI